MRGILGTKLGMTRIFDELGNSIAATVIEAGPCVVTQIKTKENEGYEAIQVGYGDRKEKHSNKPEMGHLKKADLKPFKVLKELRDFASDEPLKLGEELKADLFAEGDVVKVTGISKGKGFAGVVRRYGFGGGPKSHGQSDRWRAPGSIGQSSWPSKVFKGIRMGGRMGGNNVTTKGLKVVKVDVDNNLIIIKGAVPGANRGVVLIRK